MRALLGIDDDERTADVLRSVDWALALGPDDEVLLAHVVATLRWMPYRGTSDPGWAGTERAIFERVDDFLARAGEAIESRGVRATPLRLEGDAAEEIVRAAEENAVDVIALGAVGQARSQDFLVGSVAEKVLSLASRDVLLVRSATEDATSRFRAVLAVDGSRTSLDAIDAFAAKLRAERAEIRVLHVLEMPPASWDVGLASGERSGAAVPPALRERADGALESAVEALERHGLAAETHLRRGRAPDEILGEAQSFEASLVVVGARGNGGARPFPGLSGTVAKRVARHARCSVLVAAAREESS